MIAALTFLRTAWAWIRSNALAVVAALAAIGGLIAYALGRRSSSQSSSSAARTAEVGHAEGRAEIRDEQATEHTVRADAARDEQHDLERLQDAAEAAAERKASDVERMTPDEKVELGNALFAERRRRRQEGRGQ